MERYIQYAQRYWDTILLILVLGLIGYFGLGLILPVLTELDATVQIESETQAKMQIIVGSIKE